MMKFKTNFKIILMLSLLKVLFGQHMDSLINEKIHLTEDDTADNLNPNLSNEEESERIKSEGYSYQQASSDQQSVDQTEFQQQSISSSEMHSKKIHTNNYPSRPIFGSSSNSISKTNHGLNKVRPSIIHSHNTFGELDNQQVVQQQFDNEMDNSFVSYQQSTLSPFSNQDSQRDNNWPFSISGSSNLVTNKPTEFTVNSNTLNFTNQGLDNLKVFNITSTNHLLPPITTFTSIVPNYNNQQDPLSPMQIIANPIQNLVLRSFENFRRLIKNCESIESFLIMKMNLPKWSKLHRLDPLELPESLYFEHRDPKTPLLGKYSKKK